MSHRMTYAALVCGLLSSAHGAAAAERYRLGQPVTHDELANWDIDVRGDGQGLPAGRGRVSDGQALFAQSCAACHGDKGQGAMADALVGGKGTLTSAKPLRTIGSYWPYAPTIFDYVRRAMPFDAPQSLTADQVYALTAYLLFLNGIVGDDSTLDAATLANIEMPNRKGFTADPRPDVPSK